MYQMRDAGGRAEWAEQLACRCVEIRTYIHNLLLGYFLCLHLLEGGGGLKVPPTPYLMVKSLQIVKLNFWLLSYSFSDICIFIVDILS